MMRRHGCAGKTIK